MLVIKKDKSFSDKFLVEFKNCNLIVVRLPLPMSTSVALSMTKDLSAIPNHSSQQLSFDSFKIGIRQW